MRPLAAAAAAALLSGCATSSVALLTDERVSTAGAVAVFDAKAEAERGQLTTADTQARLDTATLRIRPLKPGTYDDLLSVMPGAPQSFTLYFVEGGTDLTEASRPVLQALRGIVTPSSDVQITGHTDTEGAADSNDRLSLARAVEIRAALVRQGLPVANAKVTGRGERELRVPTADGVAEPANRRVEVIIR
jgi:outer membrane protein OmpA-like peptidoglycan-associated protein